MLGNLALVLRGVRRQQGRLLGSLALVLRALAIDILRQVRDRALACGQRLLLLLVLHLWLQPRADTTVGARPGPWLSGAYAVIVLFGVLAVLYSFPAVRLAVTDLQGALP